MINKITIHELSDATRISYKENSEGYNAWITAVDEEDRYKTKRLKNNFFIVNPNFKYFCQYFYDWSNEDKDPFVIQNIETMGPRKSQIQNIITFIKENLVESDVAYNLGVNCFAGISRSTAIGIIAWVLSGKTPEQSLEEILKVRPQAWPNLRILRFASEIIGVDIVGPVKKWIDEEKTNIYTSIGGWGMYE